MHFFLANFRATVWLKGADGQETGRAPVSVTFIEAASVVLREGLEAILVLAALAAYLTRAGRQERLRALWLGAAAALVASVIAAWVFEQFYNGAHNDIFEGLIIFIAAALLFYVSGWLFLKQDPRAWQDYLKSQTERALAGGAGFTVAALAFFAVVREGGETILFLHVLAKTGGGWSASLVAAIAAAFAALAVLFFIIVKTTRRLPLRMVFLVTSLFLFAMGLKFIGEGMQEFQEQALISYNVVPGSRWLAAFGFNPTWEALGAQALVLVIALIGIALAAQPQKLRGSRHS
jgi:high-affinity iron transporter